MKNFFAQRNRQSSGTLKSNHRKYMRKNSPQSSMVYIQPNARSNQQILNQIVQHGNNSNNVNNGSSNCNAKTNCTSNGMMSNNSNKKNNRYSEQGFLNLSTGNGSQNQGFSSCSNANINIENKSKSKLTGSREDSLINYQLLGISHSKNFIADKRKRGKSSFHKKIVDISNNSQAYFLQESSSTNQCINKQKASQQLGNLASNVATMPKPKKIGGVKQTSSPSQPATVSVEIDEAGGEGRRGHGQISLLDDEVQQLHYRMVQFQQTAKRAVRN